MLIFAIVLISITGILCNENTCYERVEERCDDSFLRKRFPETSEELKNFCSDLIPYGKCILGIYENCGEDEEKVDFLKKAIKYGEETCDPDNAVFKGLSSNLECVKSAHWSSKATCSQFTVSEKRKEVAFYHMEILKERGYDLTEQSDCINAIWRISCTSVIIGDKCGRVARDAVQDIVLNIDYHLHDSCDEELISQVHLFTEALQTAEYQEEHVENAIRRKK